MGKPVIILADLDVSYLATLESKVLRELKDKIELEVITERTYFETYFSKPQKADLMAVGEELYSAELQRHNIGSLFVLSETANQGMTEDLLVHRIYKYSSVKEIYNELISTGLSGFFTDEGHRQRTQVIAVYSPVGGAGVTTIAVGLAAALEGNHKRTFFLSTETLQNFRFYLDNQGYLPNEACDRLKSGGHLYMELRDYLRNEIFCYLPPLYASPSALGFPPDIYKRLIEDVRMSREFDYIIVDMETGFREEKAELFADADRVMVVLQQDMFSVKKAENLMRNLEMKDNEKFVFICNRFRKEKKNYFVGSKLQEGISISEYIGELMLEETDSILKLEQFGELQQLSYLFI